ncbi:MAG TPA: alpha/beta hydrolase, partial [Brevundimonas sp.]|nr:alpha/beta hydrolase [Brevundimonas sp.]
MLHLRPFLGRSVLRALFLASALLLAGGILSLIVTRPALAQSAPTFTSDRLSVEVLGSGPDVIFIPGYASSREVWRAEAERLSTTHRVHMVQLAGFAGEPWVHGDGPFVQPVIDDLARYIDEAGLRDPAVIGHSMGGMSALMLAQQYPALVGKVMSVDSLPFFSALFGPQVTVDTARPFAEQAAAGTLAADDATFRANQTQGAAGYVNDPATRVAMVEWGMASDRQALATAIKEVMLTDLRPALPAMTTPVWAVYAADANGG